MEENIVRALLSQLRAWRCRQKETRSSRFGPTRIIQETRGYMCRKGTRIAFYQAHKERLTHPLKRKGTASGGFHGSGDHRDRRQTEEILSLHGPRALAYMGGGGQGSHVEAGFGRTF